MIKKITGDQMALATEAISSLMNEMNYVQECKLIKFN